MNVRTLRGILFLNKLRNSHILNILYVIFLLFAVHVFLMCYLFSDVKLPKYNKNKLRLFRMVISAKNAELFFQMGHVRDVLAFEFFINRGVIKHAMRRVLPSSFCSLEIEGPPPGEVR